MSLTFSQDELPDHIESPLKFISVISKSPNLQAQLDELLSHTFYQRCETGAPLEIFDALAESASKFYSVTAQSEKCKLVFSSVSPKNILLTLDEHTYFHHSYIGRHIKFKKKSPFKGSVDIETVYEATIERGEKYCKDFEYLCTSVFAKSTVDIISDMDVLKSTTINLHEKKGFHLHHLTTPVVDKVEDEPLEKLDPEDRDELYEFLSLVHLNVVPDRTNTHVAATSMYETPSLEPVSGLFDSKLYSYTASHINPLILYELASMPEVVSVQAVSASHNYLLLKSEHLYIWSAQLKV